MRLILISVLLLCIAFPHFAHAGKNAKSIAKTLRLQAKIFSPNHPIPLKKLFKYSAVNDPNYPRLLDALKAPSSRTSQVLLSAYTGSDRKALDSLLAKYHAKSEKPYVEEQLREMLLEKFPEQKHLEEAQQQSMRELQNPRSDTSKKLIKFYTGRERKQLDRLLKSHRNPSDHFKREGEPTIEIELTQMLQQALQKNAAKLAERPVAEVLAHLYILKSDELLQELTKLTKQVGPVGAIKGGVGTATTMSQLRELLDRLDMLASTVIKLKLPSRLRHLRRNGKYKFSRSYKELTGVLKDRYAFTENLDYIFFHRSGRYRDVIKTVRAMAEKKHQKWVKEFGTTREGWDARPNTFAKSHSKSKSSTRSIGGEASGPAPGGGGAGANASYSRTRSSENTASQSGQVHVDERVVDYSIFRKDSEYLKDRVLEVLNGLPKRPNWKMHVFQAVAGERAVLPRVKGFKEVKLNISLPSKISQKSGYRYNLYRWAPLRDRTVGRRINDYRYGTVLTPNSNIRRGWRARLHPNLNRIGTLRDHTQIIPKYRHFFDEFHSPNYGLVPGSKDFRTKTPSSQGSQSPPPRQKQRKKTSNPQRQTHSSKKDVIFKQRDRAAERRERNKMLTDKTNTEAGAPGSSEAKTAGATGHVNKRKRSATTSTTGPVQTVDEIKARNSSH